jgi:hypothetical protein
MTTLNNKNIDNIFKMVIEKYPNHMDDLMKYINNNQKLYNILISNYDKYLYMFTIDNIPCLLKFLNYTNYIILSKKNIDFIIDIIFSSNLVITYNNPYHDVLKLLLNEILDIENASINDITYIGSGSFSSAYRIKDLVLKVGDLRKNKTIPAHNLILKPILRRYLIDLGITIEVSRYVESINDESIVESIFYKLYDDGIVWLDPRIDNVGKIIPFTSTNCSKLPSYISNESIGFYGNNITNENESYVILDTDYLILKRDLNQEYINDTVKRYLKKI